MAVLLAAAMFGRVTERFACGKSDFVDTVGGKTALLCKSSDRAARLRNIARIIVVAIFERFSHVSSSLVCPLARSRKRSCGDGGEEVQPSRGRLAQLVERLLYMQDVGGSSPSSPTMPPTLRCKK